jgi:hypothetical protein
VAWRRALALAGEPGGGGGASRLRGALAHRGLRTAACTNTCVRAPTYSQPRARNTLKRRTKTPPQTPDLAQDDPAVSFAHLALTLLQQSHLCPLPLAAQPVHWAYDQALRVYPLPHALALVDSSAGQEEFRHEGCTVFSPVGRARACMCVGVGVGVGVLGQEGERVCVWCV